MNIAIIYHSHSGSTEKLAKLVEVRLTEVGHAISLIKLQTDVPVIGGTIRQPMNFKVTNLPELSTFDAYCIGGPVWAFGPNPVTYKAILQMDDLQKKNALPFVTMGFPLVGMGGKSALKHMSKAIAEKNGNPLPGIIVPKMFHNFDLEMEKAVSNCMGYFEDYPAAHP
ncbi:MAG: hypothetical protein R6V77_03505 [Candidatus Cloacimonadaceae bacterium]